MDNEFMLSDRIQKIKQIINQYGEDNFVLSFSGGKDSTVLHYLIDEALPGNKIPRVFINTGIEFKAIVEFVKKMQKSDPRFEIIPPHVNIKQMLEEEGYPFKSKEHSQCLEQYRKNNYEFTPSVYNYVNRIGEYNNKYGCLKRLAFQFNPNYHLKVSAKCCDRLKKDTAKEYLKANNKNWSITGIRKDEGGGQKAFRLCYY